MLPNTSAGVFSLRELHLQTIPTVWADGGQIEEFIKQNPNTYQYTDPTKSEAFKNSYWAKLVVETGPKVPEQAVSESNPYYFWAKGIAPFFDANNGRYMIQPFANNRIFVSVPKKIVGTESSAALAVKATKAIAAYFVSSPSMFREMNPLIQKNMTYAASGAKTMGDFDAMKDMFGTECQLFIKLMSRYISADNWDFKPLQQSFMHLLAPGANNLASTYNLGDGNSLYYAFGAALQNLVALIWSNECARKSVITKRENLVHLTPYSPAPGGTVQLLKELVGYDYPFFMDLIILEDEDAVFFEQVWEKVGSSNGEVLTTNPNSREYKELVDRWVWTYSKERIDSVLDSGIEVGKYYIQPKFPIQAIELMVPMQPDIKENSPVALTRYNVDSSGYPFSC